MRLISDTEVKELLLGLDSLPWEEEVDDMVDRLPTAYDVDEVVRELEEERKSAFDKFEKYRMPSFWREAYAFVDAIGIVKRGGRNE